MIRLVLLICLKLLHLMLIFPLSTACVERFFSKMKLVKTRLRNQLSQVNLENLLFIATEAPKTGFTDSEYDFFFFDELKKITKKYENRCLKHSLLVFDYQTSCSLLHKASLICLNILIFCDNTITVYVIVFFRSPFRIFVYFFGEYSSAE